jgi:hypothetical protein
VLLLEIAAQGVRGFSSPGGRMALRPGYNVVGGDGAVVRRLLQALLHPDLPADRSLVAPGTGGAPVRAGLTLTGDDGATWRVVRDLAGPCHLQRYDAGRRAFQSVEQDPRRAAEALRQAGAPGPDRFAAILCLSETDFPSRQPARGLGGASAAPPPPSRALPADEARRKLAALRDELARARAAEGVQARLDAQQQRLFKLEEMLKSGEQVGERIRAAEAALAGLASAEAALGRLEDPGARITAYHRSTARRDEALGKIATEREVRPDDAGGAARPLWRVPGLLAGAGVAVLGLVAGAVSPARSLALLAIPAGGWAAYEGLRWVRRAEEAEVSGRRIRWLAEREKKATETWERETSEIRGVVGIAGVSSVAELTDLLQRLQEARAALVDARAGLADWEARAETKDAEAERANVQQEIGELEHQLTVGTGGFVRDPQSIEVEISRLETQTDAPARAAAPEERPAPVPAGEPIRSLVERGSAELDMTPGEALRTLQPRVGQLLPVLSAQRLGNLLADERGNLQVQSGGKMVAVSQLPAADRDLCFSVLKVGFIEQALVGGKGVAMIDDGLSILPDASRRIVARVLKQIAKGRQLVHVSLDPIFREAADHAG